MPYKDHAKQKEYKSRYNFEYRKNENPEERRRKARERRLRLSPEKRKQIDKNGNKNRNIEKDREWKRKYYPNWYKERMVKGICTKCGEPVSGSKWYCEKHRLQKKEYAKEYTARKRKIVMEAYGNSTCACCGETNDKFLTLDHINGGGNKHRREIAMGGKTYWNWFIKNNFPPGFQVLCWNCNLGKRVNNGICPHEDIKGE